MDPALVQRLVTEIEQQDMSTAAHTWRVVLYARALAERFDLPDHQMELITHGAALHDIGKLDIPRKILIKPARLTAEEFEVIKQHPITGQARLVSLGVEEELILDLVRAHHERWDGLGYPLGLKGEEIPLAARVFSVIDTFDALTSYRPYRHEVGERAADHAIEELERGRGTWYWADAVDAFVQLYRGESLGWILHYYNDTACGVSYRPDAPIGPPST